MWYAIAIIVIFILLKPNILSEVISFPSSVSVSSPSQSPSVSRVSNPIADVISSSEELPPERSENFLENPALRMMAKQVVTQFSNVVQTGEMKAPTDIGGALLTMFGGDIQEGGQVGQTVGTLLASVLPSLIGEAGISGVATIGGGAIPFAGSGAAAIGSIGFGLGFAGMALGQMIGGLFEESDPLSKAQQAVIAQWQASGATRLYYLHQKGFTDQQIIKWVSDNKDLDYWYMITPIAGDSEKGLPPDYVSVANLPYWNDMKMVLSGLYTRQEKDWLDGYAESLFGLSSNFENVDYSPPQFPGGYMPVVMGPGRWGEIEAWPWGGWRQGYCDLSVELKRYAEGKTGAMQVEHMLQTSLG